MALRPVIVVWYLLVAGYHFPLSLQMSSLWQHKRHLAGRVVYPDEFLYHLGYLDNEHGFLMHTRAERRQAIRLYQQTNDLPQTGKIDKQTWSLMKKPRCAVPDVGVISPGPSPWIQKKDSAMVRSKRAARRARPPVKAVNLGNYKYKWTIPHIKWRPNRLFHRIPYDTQRAVFKEAFRRWTKPVNLLVSETFGDSEVEISFDRLEHGDGLGNAFDGEGQLLAHAFPPGDSAISGDIHFDLDEPWTFGLNTTGTTSRDLMATAIHEAGHALGLPHSTNKRDVMYPVYVDYKPDPQLSRGDVAAMQRIYGARPGFKLPHRRNQRMKNKKRVRKGRKRRRFRMDKTLPRWCRTKFNAVVLGPDKVGWVFMKKQVYRINNEGVLPGYPVHVGHEFSGAPINPATVFYVTETDKFYFFKGSRIWRFSNRTLDEGYPQKSKSTFHKKLSSAITLSGSRGRTMVFFFGENYTWRWNPHTERTNGRYFLASRFWRGLPHRVDASVEWLDGYVYFFKQNRYFKVSKQTKSVMGGYPQYKGSAWLGGECGSEPK